MLEHSALWYVDSMMSDPNISPSHLSCLRKFESYSMSNCVVLQLYAGLRSGKVLCFNCTERMFTAGCDCTGGEGTLVGLGKHEE